MVVLDKASGQAVCLELVLPKSLHKEAATILENIGHNYDDIP